MSTCLSPGYPLMEAGISNLDSWSNRGLAEISITSQGSRAADGICDRSEYSKLSISQSIEYHGSTLPIFPRLTTTVVVSPRVYHLPDTVGDPRVLGLYQDRVRSGASSTACSHASKQSTRLQTAEHRVCPTCRLNQTMQTSHISCQSPVYQRIDLVRA